MPHPFGLRYTDPPRETRAPSGSAPASTPFVWRQLPRIPSMSPFLPASHSLSPLHGLLSSSDRPVLSFPLSKRLRTPCHIPRSICFLRDAPFLTCPSHPFHSHFAPNVLHTRSDFVTRIALEGRESHRFPGPVAAHLVWRKVRRTPSVSPFPSASRSSPSLHGRPQASDHPFCRAARMPCISFSYLVPFLRRCISFVALLRPYSPCLLTSFACIPLLWWLHFLRLFRSYTFLYMVASLHPLLSFGDLVSFLAPLLISSYCPSPVVA